ncbi:uncharacterized protein LOC144036922 [Vanacampus margaritifer]
MACGIYLGVLLICLLRAEHVRCLWASQEAQGKTYVGFVQGDGGPRHDGRTGNSPQNQFRQVSRVQALARSGSSTGVSANGYRESEPSSSLGGYSSLKVVRLRPVATIAKKAVPKKSRLSTAIASSGSLSRFNAHKSNLEVKQSAGLKKPNGGNHSPPKSSSLFLPGYGTRKFLANMQTSANGAATKVLIGQKTERHHRKTYRNHNKGHKGFQSKLQRVSSGSSEAGSNGQRYFPTDVLMIPSRFGGFPIRRLKDPVTQKNRRLKSAARHAHSDTKWARVKLRS